MAVVQWVELEEADAQPLSVGVPELLMEALPQTLGVLDALCELEPVPHAEPLPLKEPVPVFVAHIEGLEHPEPLRVAVGEADGQGVGDAQPLPLAVALSLALGEEEEEAQREAEEQPETESEAGALTEALGLIVGDSEGRTVMDAEPQVEPVADASTAVGLLDEEGVTKVVRVETRDALVAPEAEGLPEGLREALLHTVADGVSVL